MNRTWNGISNSDRIGGRFDYNNFLLTADLLFNETLNQLAQADNRSLLNQTVFLENSTSNAFSSPVAKFILAFLMATMAFITVIGNSLVILAFICEATIRTYSNYFILNLSIADLLIGLICIPLYAHKVILGGWHLGYALCKIWLVFDYVVGSASTLCIVVISYDRYQMVSKGLNYLSSTKIQRALKFMFGTWLVATLNYAPAIVLWDIFPGTDPFQYRSCDPPFANNFPYLVTTAFVEFFIPFFSITTLNLLVYMNIRQRSRGLIRSNGSSHHSHPSTKSTSTAALTGKNHGDHRENGLNGSCHSKSHEQQDDSEAIKLNPPGNPLPETTTFSKSSSSAALARDRKAAKNLFIFVFVFSICWFPYTFFTLIRALCKDPDGCVSGLVYEITFWLLWLNSTINPLLYSFLHVKFRKAFYRILCFYRVRGRRRLRTL